MPRAKKTRSGDPAQKVESVAGQRYGEGVAQQQMQQAMPAPNRAAAPMPGSNVVTAGTQPAAPPRDMAAVQQMLQQLPTNMMRRPTQNARPVTHGLPTGPGAGPEVLQRFQSRVPALQVYEALARVSDDPLYKDILARFRR
jgi:hypothetical protein